MGRLFALVTVAALGLAGPGVAAAQEGGFTLFNLTSKTIDALYIVRAGETDWGSDKLEERKVVLAPGMSVDFTDVATGTYDIRIEDQDGGECEMDGVEVKTPHKLELTDEAWRACLAGN